MKTPPPVVVEGGGHPGVAGVCSSLPSPRPKNPPAGPLTHETDGLPVGRHDLAELGRWDCDIWVSKDGSRELDICFDSNRDVGIPSRQDCDDLIALLTQVRERLP